MLIVNYDQISLKQKQTIWEFKSRRVQRKSQISLYTIYIMFITYTFKFVRNYYVVIQSTSIVAIPIKILGLTLYNSVSETKSHSLTISHLIKIIYLFDVEKNGITSRMIRTQTRHN